MITMIKKKAMNRSEFAKILAKDIGADIQTTTDIINTVFRSLFRELKTAEKITIAEVGTFEVKTRKGTTRRNPRTREPVVTQDSKTITFKPSNKVKVKFN